MKDWVDSSISRDAPPVMPANAGIQGRLGAGFKLAWIPACAGMTDGRLQRACPRTYARMYSTGRDLDLGYFRDTDGREVDFVVVEGRAPVLCVEAKWGDTDVDRGLRYLKARFPDCDAWQISATGRKDYASREGIRVCPAAGFLKDLV